MSVMTPASEEQLRDIIQGPTELEWRYEMRRECQEILPDVLLGPFQVSKSLETLQRLGVTHIVCIRDAKEAFSVKPRFPERFTYLTLDVQDNEDQNLISLFPRAKEFIDDALSNGGRVLVHCNGGISLSPAFVVMYVMQYYQMSWEDALRTVANRRYCISPNGGFLTQIKEYESIYRANVVIGSHPSRMGNLQRRKREDESDGEDPREDSRKRVIRPLMRTNGGAIASPMSPTPPYDSAHDPDAMET